MLTPETLGTGLILLLDIDIDPDYTANHLLVDLRSVTYRRLLRRRLQLFLSSTHEADSTDLPLDLCEMRFGEILSEENTALHVCFCAQPCVFYDTKRRLRNFLAETASLPTTLDDHTLQPGAGDGVWLVNWTEAVQAASQYPAGQTASTHLAAQEVTLVLNVEEGASWRAFRPGYTEETVSVPVPLDLLNACLLVAGRLAGESEIPEDLDSGIHGR